MGKFDNLNWRKLISQVSDMDTVKDIITEGNKFYIGVDPTADALHLGHYLAFVVSKHLVDMGMVPVFVIGGFTAMIGDPSGKNQERPMVDNEQIKKNVRGITKAIERVVDSLEIEEYEIVNNLDFYKKMDIVELYQRYGKLFNVNTMLSRESVKKRIDNGISYTEFSYQMFQAIDFLKLYQEKEVILQLGGSDQFGNMASGLELLRKVEGPNKKVGVMTFNLITDDQGQKIGKTQGNPIWLDKKRFSSFDMYQYFFNLKDEEAKRFLAQLTFISEDEFRKTLEMASQNPASRLVQKELAKRVITRLHSKKDYEKAVKASEKLFAEGSAKGIDLSELPIITFEEGKRLAEHLIGSGHVKSFREYKEFIAQGAIKVNGAVVDSVEHMLEAFDDHVVVNIGKKRRVLVRK